MEIESSAAEKTVKTKHWETGGGKRTVVVVTDEVCVLCAVEDNVHIDNSSCL